MKKTMLLLAFLVLSANFLSVKAQNGERLEANKTKTFTLSKTGEKTLILDLKKDDFAEISWNEKNNHDVNISILSPSGKNILGDLDYINSIPFVASENGIYKLSFKPSQYVENVDKWDVTVNYENVFKMPKGAKLQQQRKINGYHIKTYKNLQEGEDTGYAAIFVIEKNGKLKGILTGESVVGGGFNFADEPSLWDYPAGKKSIQLFRTTLDKTGEGTPDVAMQYYTGGAHCCFKMHFFELGANDITPVKVINGYDSDIIAISKKPKGGLVIKTGDSNFAYWLTSFAGSPIPTVILSYQNGEFRPDVQLMKKLAPSAVVLKAKAAKAKKNMNLKPYTGEENSDFIDAFWGEMIDLMYSGNEKAAWQYFDMVWDARKPGKEKFKEDFIKKINESPYWQVIKKDKNVDN